MSSFPDFCACVTFTITLRQKPKGVTCSGRRTGFCLRVIVNVTHNNLVSINIANYGRRQFKP